jgi:hypothetical protein
VRVGNIKAFGVSDATEFAELFNIERCFVSVESIVRCRVSEGFAGDTVSYFVRSVDCFGPEWRRKVC